MARRAAAASQTATTIPAEKAPAVRRRRRTTVDQGAQTQALMDTLLKARGETGATENEILAVVKWAREIDTEGAELKTLATRVRKTRAEDTAHRQAAYEVNQALLAGVLDGTFTLDLAPNGSLIFQHR